MTFTLQRLNISNQYGNIMEIYYSLDKHHSGRNKGTGCLTCLGKFPHPGEVVHVAVAQEGIAGKVEVGGLQGGVGGEGGQVQGDKGVAIQSTTEQQSTNRTSYSLIFFANLSLIT